MVFPGGLIDNAELFNSGLRRTKSRVGRMRPGSATAWPEEESIDGFAEWARGRTEIKRQDRQCLYNHGGHHEGDDCLARFGKA